jgi:hypothetical protein
MAAGEVKRERNRKRKRKRKRNRKRARGREGGVCSFLGDSR